MSVQVADTLALALAEFRLRRALLTPIVPATVHVFLTRVQVHQLFPRLVDRYPLSVEVPGPDGPQAVSLRDRLERWPLPLERKGGRR